MWFQQYNVGGFHDWHVHPRCHFTNVYYLELPDTNLVTEIKNMASDAKLDLNIKDQKDKILEEAKSMSSSEFMEKIKSDSNFAKIILDK